MGHHSVTHVGSSSDTYPQTVPMALLTETQFSKRLKWITARIMARINKTPESVSQLLKMKEVPTFEDEIEGYKSFLGSTPPKDNNI